MQAMETEILDFAIQKTPEGSIDCEILDSAIQKTPEVSIDSEVLDSTKQKTPGRSIDSDWDQKILLRELIQGRELAKQLQIQLNVSSSPRETREMLVEKILTNYEQALSMLKWSGTVGEQSTIGDCTGMSKSPGSLSGSPCIEDLNQDFKDQEHKDASRKRKGSLTQWTEQVRISRGSFLEGPLDDGYTWTKYGMKDILGARFPRDYYRCTYRNTRGCVAKKQVQRSDEDPTIVDITYRGRHTCTQASHTVPSPSVYQNQVVPNESKEPQHVHYPQQKQQHDHQSQKPLSNILEDLKVMTEDLDTTGPFKFGTEYRPSKQSEEPEIIIDAPDWMEFKPSKQDDESEITVDEFEQNRWEKMQLPLEIEPPKEEELVKAKSRCVLIKGGLGLTEPPKEEEWEKAEEICLMDNELSELPERPLCAELLALYLQGNYKLREIPPSFFERMPALQILNLSRTGINSLPDSLFELVGLTRLFLNGCANIMMLSPKVGELKHLELLDLEGTEIIDLPKEVGNLANLTCLKVSFYKYVSHGTKNEQSDAMIHGGVISALSELEQLNIDVNPDDERWGINVEAIANEVGCLMRLNTLKLYFPRVKLLSHFTWFGPLMQSPPLSHFRFTVGHHSQRIMSPVPHDVELQLEQWDKCLKYIYGEGVPEDIKKVLRLANAFYLDRHLTVRTLSEFGVENLELLKFCILGECDEIQVIIDGKDVDEEDSDSEIVSELQGNKRIGLESLEYLNIYYMKNLRSIWEGPVRKRCFSLLKSLTLCTCPQLTTIFTLHLLHNLYSLEELRVHDCPAIESLVSCENHAKHEDYYLLKLKKISLYYVPKLVSISSGVRIAPNLEWLSFYDCPNLKSLSIEELSSTDLKRITAEMDWWEALDWTNGQPDHFEGIFVPIEEDTFEWGY